MSSLAFGRVGCRRFAVLALSTVLGLVVLGEPSASANTFNVNSTADILNPPSGTVTLRSAIQAANSTPGGNTINLTVPGTYRITIPGANTGTNASGAFVILPSGGDLSIINTSGGVVVVDGGQLDRVFDINPKFDPNNPNTAFTVTMRGFTITNGLAPPSFGGGIRTLGVNSLTLDSMIVSANEATTGGGIGMRATGTLTLNNTTVSNNLATFSGGGIAGLGVGPIVINSGSSITSNTAGLGGGLYIAGPGSGNPVQLTVQDAEISLNRAFSRDTSNLFTGGGIYSTNIVAIALNGSTIRDNIAAGAGGGLVVTDARDTVNISNCKFLNNVANMGGAILSQANLTITFSEIDGNVSGTNSGGIEADAGLTLQNSTVANNTAAAEGGGLDIIGAVSITNSTIAGNIAGNGNGGGIAAGQFFAGPLSLVGVTISGNSAGSGGGIFWAGLNNTTIVVQDSIIAKNTAAVGPDANNPAGTFTDNGGNLIGIAGMGSGNTGFTATTTQAGTTTSPLDPMLGPLQDNGGPTRTMALFAGSPALGTAVASSLTTDQRGVPRPQGPKPDVGAFELNQGATPAASLSTNLLDFRTLEVATSTPLTVTISSTGNAALTISNASISGPNASDFSFTPQAACTPLPVNLPGGQSCSDTVTFTPSAVGGRSATLTFTDNHMNAPNSRQTVALSGIGSGNPDFSISASPSSATIARGSSTNFTFTVTPINGFNQAVSFACAGLPTLAQCSFAPPSVTPNGAAVTTTLTVTTMAGTARNRAPLLRDKPDSLRASLSFAGLLVGLVLTAAAKRRRTGRLFGQIVLVGTLCVISGLAACGGGSTRTVSPGTPTGTSTITVVSQSGGTAHTASVTLTVN